MNESHMCHNSYKCPCAALIPTSAVLLYVNYTGIFIFASEREANDKKKLPWSWNEGRLCVDKLHVQNERVLFHLIWPLLVLILWKRDLNKPLTPTLGCWWSMLLLYKLLWFIFFPARWYKTTFMEWKRAAWTFIWTSPFEVIWILNYIKVSKC